MLISHRGNDKHNYKENTIDSIVFSLNQNYIDGVEFDIQLTKDNIVVLHHDFLYQNMQIEETTYNLLRLDKLEDLLKRLDTKKLLLIELKSKKNNIKFVEELDKILKKYNHLNIKLCSFNYKMIKYIKKNYNYECGLIIGENKNKFRFKNKLDFNSCKLIYLKKYKYIDYIWTINDIKIYNKIKLINKDIHIISDIPYKLKDV